MKANSITLAFVIYGMVSAANAADLANEYLHLSFDATNGGLRGFHGLKHQFFTPQPNASLWELRYRDSGSGTSSVLRAAQAKSFRFEPVDPGGARLIWDEFNLPAAPNLRVEASVQLEDRAPLSRWRIAVLDPGKLRLDQVHFPRLPDFARQEEEHLAVPFWMGQVTAQPRTLLNRNGQARELRFDYPGLTALQCLAFYRHNGPGLYLSCDDTNALHKSFVFTGDGRHGANFALIQLPVGNPAEPGDYAQPYHFVLGAFAGDWFSAAEIYRAWATNQWWVRASRMVRARNHWARDTALWVWNRGVSSHVITPALALQKELQLPVSVMWHWWHGCAYDIGFPEYLPPREGEPSFTNALAGAHHQNVHVMVYMNQRLWGMTTRSWEDLQASRHAVHGADGKIQPEIYNTFTKSPCASMCLGTPFWRNHYAGLAERAWQLGVDAIYMDQACSSLACYHPAHGHSLGGGAYWMNGFRELAGNIRDRAKINQRPPTRKIRSSSEITLAGEGVGESWLPYLDLMLSLEVSRERYLELDGWETIPFFQAVYHPWAVQYGNYSSLTMPPYDPLWPEAFAPQEPLKLLDQKFSRQFYLEQARAFVWGQQPAVANFKTSHLVERPEEMAYVLRLAKIRSRALKYLQQGTFLRSPTINPPRLTIDFSRLSIYAGQQGGLTNFTQEVPAALAGAWRAPDGNLGIALASISSDPVPLRLDLAELMHAAPARVYRITETERKKLGQLTLGQDHFDIHLPPRGICLLEFVP